MVDFASLAPRNSTYSDSVSRNRWRQLCNAVSSLDASNPDGEYLIESTLDIGPETGHHFVGCGMPQEGGSSSAQAAISWGGSTAGTMIDYRGTGLVWNGLALWGKKAGARADIGIRIHNPEDPSSSGACLTDEVGKAWFPALMIDDCATAIEATGAVNGSCPVESCAFGHFWARHCGTVVQSDSTDETGFFHLNGVMHDSLSRSFHLLKNVDGDLVVNMNTQFYQMSKFLSPHSCMSRAAADWLDRIGTLPVIKLRCEGCVPVRRMA